MNKDFPRILTLLRTENGLSQKKVASDLNVSQGLLSHYENGKRECNLDLLVKIANYFDVSCDYLLGRTTMPKPNRRSIKPNKHVQSIPSTLNEQKDRITNALKVYYSIIKDYQSSELIKNSADILYLSIYSMFRAAFSANPKNDHQQFAINKDYIPPAFAILLSSLERELEKTKITAEKTSLMKLYNEFPLEYKSLDEILHFSEDFIKKLSS